MNRIEVKDIPNQVEESEMAGIDGGACYLKYKLERSFVVETPGFSLNLG